MAIDKDVAKLKKDMGTLKDYLRDLVVWEREITKELRKQHRQNPIGDPPTVTDPPRPPR